MKHHRCGRPEHCLHSKRLRGICCNAFNTFKLPFTPACGYGSGRRKLTRPARALPTFAEFALRCQNDHGHEPWDQLPNGRWATGDETAYPWNLYRARVFHVVMYLRSQGAICATPKFAKQEEFLQAFRAAASLARMVAEFRKIVQWPAAEPLPASSRRLSVPFRGCVASAETEQGVST